MNDTLLQPIDELLKTALPAENKAQFAGRVEQIYDPQARRSALKRYDEAGKSVRFTIDTVHYDVQIAHRLTGGQPIKNPSRWGSRQEIAFDLDFTLMVATKRPEVLSSFLLAFTQIGSVEVREFSTDSLSVLKNEFLFAPDPSKPYDPLLGCFSIRYRMLNISDSIFCALTNPNTL